jgi:biopolymer transport protein ExbB/TolQ
MEFTISALWSHMGLFAKGVVLYMLVMSIVSLFVFTERLLALSKSRRQSRQYADDLSRHLGAGNPLITAEGGPSPTRLPPARGYLGRILQAGLTAAAVSRNKPDLIMESAARALERQSQLEVLSMRKGVAILATIASTAPFVGLLGTVMGIVTSFRLMAASGSGGLGVVSAGIAEALVTTAFGLIVAIPAVMAFNYLQAWIDARSVEIAASSNEILDEVARSVG